MEGKIFGASGVVNFGGNEFSCSHVKFQGNTEWGGFIVPHQNFSAT